MFKRKRRPARLKAKGRSSVARDWAGVGMRLTFRAELMPGRDAEDRTFTVARVLESGRVELNGMVGQHTRTEFESAR